MLCYPGSRGIPCDEPLIVIQPGDLFPSPFSDTVLYCRDPRLIYVRTRNGGRTIAQGMERAGIIQRPAVACYRTAGLLPWLCTPMPAMMDML